MIHRIALLALALPLAAHAVSVSSAAQLSSAVAAATDGTSISLAEGVYVVSSTLVLNGVSNVQISGPEAAVGRMATIKLNGDGNIVKVMNGATNVVFRNIIFQDAHNEDEGGAMFITDMITEAEKGSRCSVTIDNCDFRNCKGHQGGGIKAENSDLTVVDSLFDHCEATMEFGGAIHVESGRCDLTSSTFTNNVGHVSGGAVAVQHSDGELVATDCTFSGNSVDEAFGGATYVQEACDATFTRCTFNRNTAVVGGGAFHLDEEGTVRFIDCDLANNVVTGPSKSGATGGAVSLAYPDSVSFSGGTFSENVNEMSGGGAIYINEAADAATISGVTFTGNRASDGGAILSVYTDLSLEDVTFTSNAARASGGAIDTSGSGLTMSRVSFSGDSAGSSCSAINAHGALTITCAGDLGTVYTAQQACEDATANTLCPKPPPPSPTHSGCGGGYHLETGHKYGAACQTCLNHRCKPESQHNCRAARHYADPLGCDIMYCMCSCCHLQCFMPWNCPTHASDLLEQPEAGMLAPDSHEDEVTGAPPLVAMSGSLAGWLAVSAMVATMRFWYLRKKAAAHDSDGQSGGAAVLPSAKVDNDMTMLM